MGTSYIETFRMSRLFRHFSKEFVPFPFLFIGLIGPWLHLLSELSQNIGMGGSQTIVLGYLWKKCEHESFGLIFRFRKVQSLFIQTVFGKLKVTKNHLHVVFIYHLPGFFIPFPQRFTIIVEEINNGMDAHFAMINEIGTIQGRKLGLERGKVIIIQKNEIDKPFLKKQLYRNFQVYIILLFIEMSRKNSKKNKKESRDISPGIPN